MTRSSFATMPRSASKLVLGAAFGAASLALAYGPALSAGGGTSDPTPTTCPDNQPDCKNDTTKSHDERVYSEGAELALAGQYERAIAVLRTAHNQNDPRVLNYLGYSYRKLGQFGTGFAYYGRALEINPDFVLAREYLGEGFVAIGRIDKAEEQLVEIGRRCGTHCSEYQQLAQVIADANNGLTAEW